MILRQNILITGASSGLGRGMAHEFAKRGRNLALCARRVDRLAELQAELLVAYPGIKVSIRELDVNEHEQVREVFRAFREEFGSLDRVIVNAGIGLGQPLGTGYFQVNRRTAQTNFVSALAQFEAAAEIFRAQNAGHLVAISSMAAMRGMPGNGSIYSATKAGLATLAEGLRADLLRTPIKVSTIFPGFIKSEINEKVKSTPFIVDSETGCRALVRAIEREPAKACVPAWPWLPIGWLMQSLPVSVLARLR